MSVNIEAILIGLFSVAHTPEQAQHAAREIMRQHAHELAEKQRENCAYRHHDHLPDRCECSETYRLINLIDPEAQPEKRHCGWEQAHESHRWIQNGVWYLCSTEVLNSE